MYTKNVKCFVRIIRQSRKESINKSKHLFRTMGLKIIKDARVTSTHDLKVNERLF